MKQEFPLTGLMTGFVAGAVSYVGERTDEIAEILGIHTTRVCQLKSQAVLRLRAYVVKKWPSTRGIL